MKRTALNRRTPLRRGGPLRARSRRAVARATIRRRLISDLVTAGRARCELGPVIRLAVPDWSGCTGRVDGLHEIRKRSSGGSLTRLDNLRPACNPCNEWCEDHPALARTVGLVVRPGDPLFASLADERT